MATMPKCSGPTAWTRGTSWPLGFCKTNALRGLDERALRGRDMGSSFQEEDRSILNTKGSVGKAREFFCSANPHTTERANNLEPPRLARVTCAAWIKRAHARRR